MALIHHQIPTPPHKGKDTPRQRCLLPCSVILNESFYLKTSISAPIKRERLAQSWNPKTVTIVKKQKAKMLGSTVRAPTVERGRPVSLTDGCFSFREPLLSTHPTDDPDRQEMGPNLHIWHKGLLDSRQKHNPVLSINPTVRQFKKWQPALEFPPHDLLTESLGQLIQTLFSPVPS